MALDQDQMSRPFPTCSDSSLWVHIVLWRHSYCIHLVAKAIRIQSNTNTSFNFYEENLNRTKESTSIPLHSRNYEIHKKRTFQVSSFTFIKKSSPTYIFPTPIWPPFWLLYHSRGTGVAFNGTAFLNVIPILSLMSISSGFMSSANTQSNACNRDPSANGSTREASGTAGHILRPDPNGMNLKCCPL